MSGESNRNVSRVRGGEPGWSFVNRNAELESSDESESSGCEFVDIASESGLVSFHHRLRHTASNPDPPTDQPDSSDDPIQPASDSLHDISLMTCAAAGNTVDRSGKLEPNFDVKLDEKTGISNNCDTSSEGLESSLNLQLNMDIRMPDELSDDSLGDMDTAQHASNAQLLAEAEMERSHVISTSLPIMLSDTDHSAKAADRFDTVSYNNEVHVEKLVSDFGSCLLVTASESVAVSRNDAAHEETVKSSQCSSSESVLPDGLRLTDVDNFETGNCSQVSDSFGVNLPTTERADSISSTDSFDSSDFDKVRPEVVETRFDGEDLEQRSAENVGPIGHGLIVDDATMNSLEVSHHLVCAAGADSLSEENSFIAANAVSNRDNDISTNKTISDLQSASGQLPRSLVHDEESCISRGILDLQFSDEGSSSSELGLTNIAEGADLPDSPRSSVGDEYSSGDDFITLEHSDDEGDEDEVSCTGNKFNQSLQPDVVQSDVSNSGQSDEKDIDPLNDRDPDRSHVSIGDQSAELDIGLWEHFAVDQSVDCQNQLTQTNDVSVCDPNTDPSEKENPLKKKPLEHKLKEGEKVASEEPGIVDVVDSIADKIPVDEGQAAELMVDLVDNLQVIDQMEVPVGQGEVVEELVNDVDNPAVVDGGHHLDMLNALIAAARAVRGGSSADDDNSLAGDVDDRCESDISGIADDDDDLSSMSNFGDEPIVLQGGAHVYVHQPNTAMNATLTMLSVMVILFAIGVGFGHFLGSKTLLSRMSSMSVKHPAVMDDTARLDQVESIVNKLLEKQAASDALAQSQMIMSVTSSWRKKYSELVVEQAALEYKLKEATIVQEAADACKHNLEQERTLKSELSQQLADLELKYANITDNLVADSHDNETVERMVELITKITWLEGEHAALTNRLNALIDTNHSCSEELRKSKNVTVVSNERLRASSDTILMRDEHIESLRAKIDRLTAENFRLRAMAGRGERDGKVGVRGEGIQSTDQIDGALRNELNELKIENDELKAELLNQRYSEHPGNGGSTDKEQVRITTADVIDVLYDAGTNLTQLCMDIIARDSAARNNGSSSNEGKNLLNTIVLMCTVSLRNGSNSTSRYRSYIDQTIEAIRQTIHNTLESVENISSDVLAGKHGEFVSKISRKVTNSLKKFNSKMSSKLSGIGKKFDSWKHRWFGWFSRVGRHGRSWHKNEGGDNNKRKSEQNGKDAPKNKVKTHEWNPSNPGLFLHEEFFDGTDHKRMWSRHERSLAKFIERLQRLDAATYKTLDNDLFKTLHHLIDDFDYDDVPAKLTAWLSCQHSWWTSFAGKKNSKDGAARFPFDGCNALLLHWQLGVVCELVLKESGDRISISSGETVSDVCHVLKPFDSNTFVGKPELVMRNGKNDKDVKNDELETQGGRFYDNLRSRDVDTLDEDDEIGENVTEDGARDYFEESESLKSDDKFYSTDIPLSDSELYSMNDPQSDNSRWYFDRMFMREDWRHDPNWYLRGMKRRRDKDAEHEKNDDSSNWYMHRASHRANHRKPTDNGDWRKVRGHAYTDNSGNYAESSSGPNSGCDWQRQPFRNIGDHLGWPLPNVQWMWCGADEDCHC